MRMFRTFVMIVLVGCALSARADLTGLALAGAEVCAPLLVCVLDGACNTPPIRMFGTEQGVYGLDIGSLACKAEMVQGMQLSMCGGAVERQMNGLQIGVVGTGVSKKADLSKSCVNGIQLGGILARGTTINGIQIGGFKAETKCVNGLQIGLWNEADDVRGLQLGIYNQTSTLSGVQLGVLNRRDGARHPYLPLLRVVID